MDIKAIGKQAATRSGGRQTLMRSGKPPNNRGEIALLGGAFTTPGNYNVYLGGDRPVQVVLTLPNAPAACWLQLTGPNPEDWIVGVADHATNTIYTIYGDGTPTWTIIDPITAYLFYIGDGFWSTSTIFTYWKPLNDISLPTPPYYSVVNETPTTQNNSGFVPRPLFTFTGTNTIVSTGPRPFLTAATRNLSTQVYAATAYNGVLTQQIGTHQFINTVPSLLTFYVLDETMSIANQLSPTLARTSTFASEPIPRFGYSLRQTLLTEYYGYRHFGGSITDGLEFPNFDYGMLATTPGTGFVDTSLFWNDSTIDRQIVFTLGNDPWQMATNVTPFPVQKRIPLGAILPNLLRGGRSDVTIASALDFVTVLDYGVARQTIEKPFRAMPITLNDDLFDGDYWVKDDEVP
jgi:hypothetical protein